MDRSNSQRAVDIIVPVYNGYDDLVHCIESLRKYTDLSRHRVILIDDCSADERVKSLIRGVCGVCDVHSDHGMIAVFNEKNRGFSANVNTGLSWSGRDTILLNSDTVVTHGWVEKLQACACRSERIATVTPLSNAATLSSVPYFLKDNPIPEGFTVESYGRLVERVSLHRYPRISVGVGFCLYVRQTAFEQVGPFDEKAFGRGYGEENDFCFRCSMLGFIHVLCDDTFIYHKGTASFDTEEKKRLVEAHEQILRRRYPKLMEENDTYCREDPDSEIRDNLLLHQCIENGKKNLLYFLHLDFRQVAQKNIGGTQLHVKDLVMGTVKNYNVFVCARDKDTLRLTVYLDEERLVPWRLLQSEETDFAHAKMISLKFPIGEEEDYPVFYDEKLAHILRSVLSSFSIDMVHVHHTQGLSLDIFHVCREMEIPVIATLHDYYYACPTTKLLQPSGVFCPATEHFASISDRFCAGCLKENCGYGRVRVMKRWRGAGMEALSACEKIVFPSRSAKEIMCSVFEPLAGRSVTIGHGTDAASAGSCPVKRPDRIEKTGRMHSRLDQLPGDGGSFHYISGWAYLEGTNSIDTSIIIEVTDADGNARCMQVRKQARPDVAAACAQPDYLWCGIHAVFQVPGMKPGRIRIRLLIREKDRVWTDGKVYRTSIPGMEDGRGKLNVAYLGGVTPAKGSGLLAQLLKSGDDSFNLFVFGEVGDPRIQVPRHAKHVFFSGVYQKEDIFDLLRASRIDVALIPPIWAETFCYTLSEAWSCGIPVIGTDIGAVGERISSEGAGWLIAPDADGDDVRQLLEHIRSHPEELREKKEQAAAVSLRSVEDMNREYQKLYESYMVPTRPVVLRSAMDSDPEFLLEALAMANPAVKGSGAATAMNRLREENDMLKTSMEMLKNTTSYRVARKISEADIPFKEPLKKLLKKRSQGDRR